MLNLKNKIEQKDTECKLLISKGEALRDCLDNIHMYFAGG